MQAPVVGVAAELLLEECVQRGGGERLLDDRQRLESAIGIPEIGRRLVASRIDFAVTQVMHEAHEGVGQDELERRPPRRRCGERIRVLGERGFDAAQMVVVRRQAMCVSRANGGGQLLHLALVPPRGMEVAPLVEFRHVPGGRQLARHQAVLLAVVDRLDRAAQLAAVTGFLRGGHRRAKQCGHGKQAAGRHSCAS